MKTLVLLTIISTSTFASKMVAVVKMFRGQVFQQTDGGQKTPIKKNGEKIIEGTVIHTEAGSFAQLRFIDNSVVNVGPKSEMKIEQFSRNKPGLLSVVKGEIRSQVTKDYLEIGKDERDKLYVKSKSAAMGIRGTDFIYSFNPGNNTTTAVLLEGEVAFAKVGPGANYEQVKNSVINNSVTLYPGEFSVSKPELRAPSVPAVINIKQRELLTSNRNMGKEKKDQSKKDVTRAPASVKKPVNSVVPPGLNGAVVANEAKGIDSGVQQIAKNEVIKAGENQKRDANGFVKEGNMKPANGSIVHIETGVIIPPKENSELDKNTNSYVSSGDLTILSVDGDYTPPGDDVQITEDGKIMITAEDGSQTVQEAPSPVLGGADNMTLLAEGPPPIGANGEPLLGTNGPPPPNGNDVMNGGFVQDGLNDFSNQQNNTGYNPTAPDQNNTVIRFNIQVQ